MDENINKSTPSPKKIKGKNRINFVDFVVLILIIGIIALSVMIFSPNDLGILNDNTTAEIEYTICFTNVPSEIINNIKIGNTAIDSASKCDLGDVERIRNNEKYFEYAIDQITQMPVIQTFHDRYNIYVTIRSSAEYTEEVGYTVNGCRIAVGKEFNVRFPTYSGTGYCVDMKEVEDK